MTQTSQSLLERAKQHHDPEAWQRLVTVYDPWLRGWLAQHQLQPVDVDDVVQNILVVVSQKLPAFAHSGQAGAFRSWLRTILVNQVRYFLRTRRNRQALGGEPQWLDQLEDPGSSLSQQWDAEHDRELVRRVLATVQPEFQPRTWEAFRLLVLENLPAAEVARRCQMEPNSVYVAKSRVLGKLRQELRGLMEF
jgi:RNA polymerase sigma factor (sigma-70 family)